MKKKTTAEKTDTGLNLEEIKRITVTAMFADDQLFDSLVLKGGNALRLIYRLGSRASIDLDFSMQHDLPDGVDGFCARVEMALKKTFQLNGYEVFDLELEVRPKEISLDLGDFWGGYAVEFKLIPSALYKKYAPDLDELRKYALEIGQKKKFLIDISRFEYTYGKQEREVDGYRIYVYSPEMIVCEKLRAVCQQMPEYGPVIRRNRSGRARARDFVDIHVLTANLCLDITLEKNQEILSEMFSAKKVPLALLGQIANYREFHRADFPAVVATSGVELKEFDFYFDFVLQLVAKLKPLWDV